MKIFIEQTFPLGRFHATTWGAFPYDEPHGGEWPPSPWRLLRAVIARSYQLERETGNPNDEDKKRLVTVIAESSISWRLPEFSWRGPGLRQYQPAEFKRVPASVMTYNTTKVQDNFWLTPPKSDPIIWILESDGWTQPLQNLLAKCLDRMTYFGRAESITHMQLLDNEPADALVNCSLTAARSRTSIPVICPKSDVTLEQVRMTTNHKDVANSTIPPGAIQKFVIRPKRTVPKHSFMKPPKQRHSVNLIQFAIGGRVDLTKDQIVILTNRFRGRTVRSFLGCSWQEVKEEGDIQSLNDVSLLSGKDATGKALKGNRHTYYSVWFDPETGRPSRLLVWRKTFFSEREQKAMDNAAQKPISVTYGKNIHPIHLIPLDSAVQSPCGFDQQKTFTSWKSVTPYIPPRHIFNRRGEVKPGESIPEQVARQSRSLGLPECQIQFADNKGQWVKVHQSSKKGNSPTNNSPTNASKRGFHINLEFKSPVSGPIALGHSCHFGLGLFVPA